MQLGPPRMSQEPITFDPSSWTGIRPPQRPNPEDFPYPLPLEARASFPKHFLVSCGMVLFGALPLALVLLRLFVAPMRNRPTLDSAEVLIAAAIFMALTALISGAGFAMLWQLCRRGVASRPAIEMDAHGLTIPKWFEETIPWSEVIDVRPLRIRDEARFKPTMRRTISTPRRSVPMPVPLPDLLDVPQRELFRALQAHWAHLGNGGQSG
jgi:hypothetical protein